MKKLLILSTLIGSFATASFAEDVDLGLDFFPSWNGVYGGVSLGGDVAGGNDLDFGAHLTYRHEVTNEFLVGVEGSYATSLGGNGDDRAALEAMAGYNFGPLVTYVSAGYAWDNGEGGVYGVGVDYRTVSKDVIGVKVTYDDFGSNETNLSVRYSFDF